MNLFLCYPKCSTCQKALKWLERKGIQVTVRDIKADRPGKEELAEWIRRSGLDEKRFFNTSGLVYKELGLKDKLADMSLEDRLEVLSSDGMLVKRPLFITEKGVLVGFREKEWENSDIYE